MKSIHVISSFIHYNVAKEINRFAPKSVVDMGGEGKLAKFIPHKVTDANLTAEIDATCLPWPDNTFDIAVSIATLEHVDNWQQFLLESLRVSSTAVIHWFPCGRAAKEAELLKKTLGHEHPCALPDELNLKNFLSNYRAIRWSLAPLMTVGEHLLLLGTINSNLNHPRAFEVIHRIGRDPYGFLLTMTKRGNGDDSQ